MLRSLSVMTVWTEESGKLDATALAPTLSEVASTIIFLADLAMARAMAKSAKKMIVLATSDKVGANAVASSFPLSSVHTVITDKDLSKEGRGLLDQAGVEVITV